MFTLLFLLLATCNAISTIKNIENNGDGDPPIGSIGVATAMICSINKMLTARLLVTEKACFYIKRTKYIKPVSFCRHNTLQKL